MTQGPLPLVLLAARDHPNQAFREKLWCDLENWLNQKFPRFNVEESFSMIDQQKGTFFEPFVVTGEDRRLAGFLLRLALSEGINASRFRVVSEETIGNEGGAVFTRKGKCFYSERFALGKNKFHYSRTQFFAPSMKISPPRRKVAGQIPSAFMEVTEEGVFIHLIMDSFEQLDWDSEQEDDQLNALAKRLTQETVIGDKSTPIGELGLSIQVTNQGIVISSKSPESLIRLSSYIVQSSRIFIRGLESYEFVIQMPETGNGEADCLIVAKDQFACDWMNVSGFGAPDIDSKDINRISEWAMPHTEWANQIIKEGM